MNQPSIAPAAVRMQTPDSTPSVGFDGPDPQPVDRALASLILDNYDRVDQRRGKPPIDRT